MCSIHWMLMETDTLPQRSSPLDLVGLYVVSQTKKNILYVNFEQEVQQLQLQCICLNCFSMQCATFKHVTVFSLGVGWVMQEGKKFENYLIIILHVFGAGEFIFGPTASAVNPQPASEHDVELISPDMLYQSQWEDELCVSKDDEEKHFCILMENLGANNVFEEWV